MTVLLAAFQARVAGGRAGDWGGEACAIRKSADFETLGWHPTEKQPLTFHPALAKPAMSGGGVFTAFPDKVHRHWKSFAIAFVAISTFLYVVIPNEVDDGAFDVRGVRSGCLALPSC